MAESEAESEAEVATEIESRRLATWETVETIVYAIFVNVVVVWRWCFGLCVR